MVVVGFVISMWFRVCERLDIMVLVDIVIVD